MQAGSKATGEVAHDGSHTGAGGRVAPVGGQGGACEEKRSLLAVETDAP